MAVDGYCLTHQQQMVLSHDNNRDNNIVASRGVGGQTFVPCINVTLPTVWLNRPDVRKGEGERVVG